MAFPKLTRLKGRGGPTTKAAREAAAAASPTFGQPAVIDPKTIPRGKVLEFGEAPDVPEGPLSEEVATAVETLYGEPIRGRLEEAQLNAIVTIANSGDTRLTWLLSDHLRVNFNLAQKDGMRQGEFIDIQRLLEKAAAALTGLKFRNLDSWNPLVNTLMAWDIPAPPDYLASKRNIYARLEPEWFPLMSDNSVLDWRHVSWGGVFIDNRPYDTTDDWCNCIPAIDNPTLLTASEGTWLRDDAIVFGVVINGEARAYPRQIMEVREMVNDTLGGRSIGMPYCTLCGAAQVWFTDGMPEGVKRPTLRTSGLLIRSNKVMFDLETFSVFDTFLGHAVTGPLAARGVALKQAGVVTTTWGEWKAAHPETTVLERRLALGRDFDFRNGRDANGPIFPIGDVDPALPVQADVLGIITAGGTPIAFPVDAAAAALERGEDVTFEEIRVVQHAGGLRAVDAEGKDLGAHQAFWFAWSQFHPGTQLWQP